MKMNIKFVKNNLTELNSYVGFIVLLISMYVFESGLVLMIAFFMIFY